jgi:hypothetical protein
VEWIGADFIHLGFQVLRAASMKMAVFWVVALCNVTEFYSADSHLGFM